MSSASTSIAELVPGAITLACPRCRRPDRLHAVELVEVLSPATFTAGSAEPVHDEYAIDITLDDTQHWPGDGAIACRHCDQVDLRYTDLVPLIALTDPAAAGFATTLATAHRGAQP
jgi:hypothetical protein